MARLALGLDSSTQSITAVVVDIDTQRVVYKKSLDYKADSRLDLFGLNEQYILPPREQGEANQPAAMYFASLDAIFADMVAEFPDHDLKLTDIAVINVSGQQHGHVLLNQTSQKKFEQLKAGKFSADANIVDLLESCLALDFARIWRTSCTAEQADFVRRQLGGKERIIQLTGSNAPLRFSAFGISRTGRDYPEQYQEAVIIHQISSLLPAVLTGDYSVGLDFGNACGTSLMDYRKKQWSAELIAAVSQSLPGGQADLAKKLPTLKSGTTLAGVIANYFICKYGFDPECAIGIGSGDNPQTKVLVAGSLLSLGSSFVNMVETDGTTFDMAGSANAMYDAFDRPFMFGCRTNGALRWDNVRSHYGIAKSDYQPSEKALAQRPPANEGRMYLWQAENESFPASGCFGPIRIGYDGEDFACDFVGIVESTLAAVYLHSRGFMRQDDILYVAGGATQSPGIMKRLSAIWNRNIIPIEKAGAALGAAVSGAYALLLSEGAELDAGEFGSSFLKKQAAVKPQPADVNAYHGPAGFLKRYEAAEAKLMTSN
jgi:xylulokinase